MEHITIKQSEGVYMVMQHDDLTGLNIIRDDRNNVYLEGDVTFTDTDFNWLITRKVYDYDIQLEVRYDGIDGVMSLAGEWNYDRKRCKLKVSGTTEYDRFKTILSKEYVPVCQGISWDYDSWVYSAYGTSGLNTTGKYYEGYYDNGSYTPPTYNAATTYGAANDLTGGDFAGSLDKFVFLSGSIYASLQDNNLGNDPATSPLFWEEIPDLIEYTQERALFAPDTIRWTYDELNKYWYKSNYSSASYTGTCLGYNIKTQLESILQDNDFTLNLDWLNYASFYAEKLWIVNTKDIEKVKLSEVIDCVEQTFFMKHYLNGTELYFRHWTEQQTDWSASLPIEHDLSSINLPDWTRDEFKNVKRHRLNFTESDLGTHTNSVIEYDNLYFEDAEVKPAFDVDFVYAINEGDTNCLVTIDSTTIKVDYDVVYNPYLIPADLHEQFYFDGREFNKGLFQENFVSLLEDYSEKADIELNGNYDINNWDVFYLIRINGLTGKSAYNFAKLDKVVYSIDKNNYKLTLRTKT